MVRVSPEKYSKTLFIPGFDGKPRVALTEYWIDRYEVTNRQYKDSSSGRISEARVLEV